MAIRTKKPLAVPLAPLVWKLLVGETATIDDLEEIDSLYTQSLRGIRDIHLSGVTEETFHEVQQNQVRFKAVRANLKRNFFFFVGNSIGMLRDFQQQW